jgi:hypothetical protein
MFGLRIEIYADDLNGVTYQLHGKESIMYKAWQSGFEDEADYMPFGC